MHGDGEIYQRPVDVRCPDFPVALKVCDKLIQLERHLICSLSEGAVANLANTALSLL
jgi:hypothetical protein